MRFLSFFLLFLPLFVSAEIQVSDAWSRATPPGMPMGAVYAEIQNRGGEDRTLVRIEAEQAKLAEIHESVEIDGMMRMREITPFIVPAGETVSLEPGGKHIMLMKLNSALKKGEKVRLRATFDDESQVAFEAVVGGFGQMSLPN